MTQKTRQAVEWRAGFFGYRHALISRRTSACGASFREERYDRPDWPKCEVCRSVVER